MASNAQEPIINLLVSILFKYTICSRKNYHQIMSKITINAHTTSCPLHQLPITYISCPLQPHLLYLHPAKCTTETPWQTPSHHSTAQHCQIQSHVLQKVFHQNNDGTKLVFSTLRGGSIKISTLNNVFIRTT